MNQSNSKYLSSLILATVGVVLALLIGLVRSADRDASSARMAGTRAPSSQVAGGTALRVPIIPTQQEAAPPTPLPSTPEGQTATNSKRRGLTRLAGLVLRPEGEPAAGARVVLGQQHARCAPDGSFELVLTSDPGAGDLIAYEPGYEPRMRPAFGASLRPNDDNQVRLVLGPSTYSLSGIVMSTDGRPLKGWTVELDEIDPLTTFGLRDSVRTDAEGAFLIADVAAGIHVVRAFKGRREQSFLSAPISAGQTGLTITVDPGN